MTRLLSKSPGVWRMHLFVLVIFSWGCSITSSRYVTFNIFYQHIAHWGVVFNHHLCVQCSVVYLHRLVSVAYVVIVVMFLCIRICQQQGGDCWDILRLHALFFNVNILSLSLSLSLSRARALSLYLSLSLSHSSQVALSALLWLWWWFFAICPDRSPVVMQQQCPAWSILSNPGTRSLLVCTLSACLPSSKASIFSPYRSCGRCGKITSLSSPPYSFSTSRHTQYSPTPIYSISSPSKNLKIMNTQFLKKEGRRWTWRSPDGHTRNEIDYIMTDKPSMVTDVTVINRINIGGDHRMVMGAITLNTRAERRKLINKNTRTRVDTHIIGTKNNTFQLELKNRFTALQEHDDMDSLNKNMTEVIQESAMCIAK